ncbi:Nmad5 family putative nucleotide modification protein [Salmonella enterica]|uniref:Nmad5 family putative nucleotide modification protein n=1 Tax=Salmonella enterica TaxID=28901 RepID=UPI00331509AC
MTLEINARINNEIRSAIKAKAYVTSGIEQSKKALITKRAQFAEKVRQKTLEMCGVTEAELDAKYKAFLAVDIESSNQGFNGVGKFIGVNVCRGHNRYVFVAINGQSRYLYLNGSVNGENTHIEIAEVKDGGPWVNRSRILISDDSLLAELMSLDKDYSDLVSKEETFNNTLDAVLKNARTVKQLLTAWPEAKELLPDALQKATCTALAINPEELNAICGIPSVK